MLIHMQATATQQEISQIIILIEDRDLMPHLSRNIDHSVIGVTGRNLKQLKEEDVLNFPGVDYISPLSLPYKLASREFQPENTSFKVKQTTFGGKELAIIAGPCAIESRQQLLETALAVKAAGGNALRGGAYKPRSSPYAFQGLGLEGLAYLAEAGAQTGLPVVTEVLSEEQLPQVMRYADVLQIGARNMQNYALLHAVGQSQHPVLLKRGMTATIEELLMAAEYILSHGNRRIMLCERGIRTFETQTRNSTDINAIPVLKELTHLPVLLDPSHATGHAKYVSAVALAGVAAGCDGLEIEVHIKPEEALSDGNQSLTPEAFAKLVEKIRRVAQAVERTLV